MRIVLVLCAAPLFLTACSESPKGGATAPAVSQRQIPKNAAEQGTIHDIGHDIGTPVRGAIESGSQETETLATESPAPVSDESKPLETSPASKSPASKSPASSETSQVSSPLLEKRRQRRNALIDPNQDGWDSEVRAERVQQQLEQIAAAVAKGAAHASDLENVAWVDPEFRCGDLYSPDGEVVFQSPQLQVKRPTLSATVDGLGKTRFAQAFSAIASWFPTGAAPRTHVKTIGVTADGPNTSTKHIVSLYWSHDGRSASYHATWVCDWREVGKELHLLGLQATDVEDVQSVDTRSGSGHWFQDETAALFAACASYNAQLVPGMNHWLRRIDVVDGMYIFAEYGLAVGDVNGDQLDDLYICQPAGLPNRLFLQTDDGQVRDISESSGTNWLDQTSSALLIDLDNDGDQDLALAVGAQRLLVMENDGSGQFQLKNSLPFADRNVKGLSASDYDSDGDLDLYLTIAFADSRARPDEPRPEFLYHDANDGGANVLFQNNISATDWKFTDVTRQSGLDDHNRRHSLAAAWEDFDNDGDQDLYVANDYGQNCLYRNDAGKFQDIADTAGTVDYGGGMSVDWSDYDRDGWMDLYVANMFSSAGRRITEQHKFRQETGDEVGKILTRFAKGNTLMRNLGDGQFSEVGGDARVEYGRWAWASVFGDWNNDGWDDLFVANGYVTNDDSQDL